MERGLVAAEAGSKGEVSGCALLKAARSSRMSEPEIREFR
jgi:hypothetical protein